MVSKQVIKVIIQAEETISKTAKQAEKAIKNMGLMGSVNVAAPTGEYVSHPFFRGFLEGYNTMDALASLAFGIIIVNAVRNLGVKEPKNIAKASAH